MRQEKQLLLDEIKEKMDGSTALVLTRYQSLNPDLSNDFRNVLGNAGGAFAVVKKRILLKAAKENGLSLTPEMLDGHIGVMFAYKDPISPTKALFKFVKDNKEKFEIVGGQFEGRLCNAKEIEVISDLPSEDEMRAQFLGLLEAPLSQTLSVMNALLTSVLYCLENKSQQE